MIGALLLLLAATAAVDGRAAKRSPTLEQPHVVLASRSLNTYDEPAFHADARFRPLAADVRHEYIVQVKTPVVASRTVIGACVRACVCVCVCARARARCARPARAHAACGDLFV